MREILFKGKRVDNGEWVYGFLVEALNCVTDKNETFIIEQDATYFTYGEFACAVEVKPETVGQFTGLCDKNGKKIFEGDIVRDWDGRIYEIKYFDFEWIAEQPKSFWINIKHLKPCEVIGNIYDNKEEE